VATVVLLGALLLPRQQAPAQGTAATPPVPIVRGFSSDLLASLPTGPLSAGPLILVGRPGQTPETAVLTLVRYSYAPGGMVSLPYPYPGPVVYYVERGTLGLSAIGPAVTIVHVTSRGGTPGTYRSATVLGPPVLTPSGRYTVAAGDYVYAMDGRLGPSYNAGAGRLVVTAAFLQPMPVMVRTPIAAPGTPSTP